ncbi:MAG TPA: hypothetical protein VNH44_05745 [Micropepsaceae bacterium]|nr:hypothetical protein [Micropepsaceae bacterium]
MANANSITPIEVRVENISQLFDTLDPFPFPERDLDKDAEDYIVGWARELPRDQPIVIYIHLPPDELSKHGDPNVLASAFRRFFDYRAGIVVRDLNELFRVGRTALLIGLVVLALCLTAARVTTNLFDGAFGGFLQESLIILGWVANWKPIEIFLYDWWPLVRRRNLYRRLGQATVQFQPSVRVSEQH